MILINVMDIGRVEINRIDCYHANLENGKQIYTDIGGSSVFYMKVVNREKVEHLAHLR